VTPTSFGTHTAVSETSEWHFVFIVNGRIGATPQAFTPATTSNFVIAENPCPNPIPVVNGDSQATQLKLIVQ
jgi:hypothetical protein